MHKITERTVTERTINGFEFFPANMDEEETFVMTAKNAARYADPTFFVEDAKRTARILVFNSTANWHHAFWKEAMLAALFIENGGLEQEGAPESLEEFLDFDIGVVK